MGLTVEFSDEAQVRVPKLKRTLLSDSVLLWVQDDKVVLHFGKELKRRAWPRTHDTVATLKFNLDDFERLTEAINKIETVAPKSA
jgi:hypothetical protein